MTHYPPLRILGLMSGTSLDGVDACLCEIALNNQLKFELLAFDSWPMPAWLRTKVENNLNPQTSQIDQLCELNVELGEWLAGHALKLLENQNISPQSIDLIGSHGQTLYHIPPGGKQIPSTLQLGEPAIIARRTGITTIANFRPADMAVGGHGAPLVPFLDQWLVSHLPQPVVLQNIGGIGNLTYIHGDTLFAFDTGPGNVLMDYAVKALSQGQASYDQGGQWASQGQIAQELLNTWLNEPYFKLPPPKSTGRELFSAAYAQRCLDQAQTQGLSPADSLATITALTSHSILKAYGDFLPLPPKSVIVSGGGAHNQALLAEIGKHYPVQTLDALGISADAKESIAFAVMAYFAFWGLANNLPQVTGAREAVIMGQWSPGQNFEALLKKRSKDHV